jgi:2-dehydropantoate 2-reductase
MRIAVIGAGAMGSLFASCLADTAAEVWAYDQWREHVEAINRNGLTVRRDQRERSIRLNASTSAEAIGVCDAVLVMVKFNQTKAAMEAAGAMISTDTLIVTLQNGLGNVDLIRSLYPANPIGFGLTTLTSELLGPGRIEASHTGRGETHLWIDGGTLISPVVQFCALLVDGGINAMLAPDIELRIWNKLIVNCCLNTLCAITGLPVGPLVDRPEAWPLLDGIADEIVSVAARKGIPLGHDTARVFLRSVAAETRKHLPSMAVDVLNRRLTEIEGLNGAILRECELFGIPAPHNASVYALIRVIENSYGDRGTS